MTKAFGAIGVAGTLLVASLATPAYAAVFATGDVIASIGNGQVAVYSSAGALKTTLNTGQGGFTTGSTTDKNGNVYVTNFSTGSVTKFDKDGVNQGLFASGYTNPESILFDKSGTAYVGDAGQNHIHVVGSSDLTVAIEDRGTDWIDLAANQTTIYYTSEGKSILRYDTVTGQMSPFATGLPGSVAYALRLLGNGNVLVADTDFTLLLDGSGNVLQTYDFNDHGMFSLNLTEDGTHFWTGSYATGNLYKVNLATGATVQTIATGSGSLFGVSVYGEVTQGGGGVGGVPEPSTWALLILGFGGVGAVLRRARRNPQNALGALA